jgi:dipeptidyl-peptidase-4
MTVTSFPVGKDGFMAPVKMYTPKGLDVTKKHPMILYIYGGPGAQQVSSRWTLGWESYLSSSKDIVYVLMDGRGTGYQSNEYKFQVYRNLGTVEMDDQISVTRQIAQQFDYIDPDRIGIWGWSYGGFNTAMTLERDTGSNPVFSCGISVAPVTSWLLYDSIYTERFMSLPSDNEAGYNNSVISGIENLRGKKWLLNHGVADDNVHYQHSMLLTRALELADIRFEQHSYADENHSLRGVSRFLYHAMDDFWNRCFNL